MEGARRPAPGLGLGVELSQHGALTPVARQLLDVLAATQADVDGLVDARVAANPLLVRGPPRRCRWCASPLRAGRCPTCSGSGTGAGPPAPDDAAPESVRERVRLDARALVPPGAEADVDAVLALLDDRGLLPADVPVPRTGRWAVALDAVRAAAPAGTAERGLPASLVAQARWQVAHGAPDLVLVLVRDHLDRIGSPDLARRVGAPAAEVDAAVHLVRTRLTPAPLPTAGRDEPTVPPDVVVREVGGRLEVAALGPEDLGLAVDPELAALALDPASQAWRDGHLEEARRVLYLLGRRADTLHRVAAVAVEVQEEFVRRGRVAHRPLTRAQVAERLGVHPSTVSRVVHGAVVALPGRRVLPLAALFGTAESAREQVVALFASADPPRTDAEACRVLAARGLHLARRTVAHYRETDPARAAGRAAR